MHRCKAWIKAARCNQWVLGYKGQMTISYTYKFLKHPAIHRVMLEEPVLQDINVFRVLQETYGDGDACATQEARFKQLRQVKQEIVLEFVDHLQMAREP